MGINIGRWRKAQKAQANTWKARPPQLTETVRRANLAALCRYSALSENELRRMRILEIGGPVVERAFSNADVPPKITLDPLFPFVPLVGQQNKSCQRVRGMGEYLPLADKSMDLCWCANTIDHTFSPATVLAEVKRVLSDRGVLVISCHTFPTWTKPLFPLFNHLDAPHPHHFTLDGFRTLLRSQFEIREEYEVTSGFRMLLQRDSRVTLVRDLKKKMAILIRMRLAYFRCVPVRNENMNREPLEIKGER